MKRDHAPESHRPRGGQSGRGRVDTSWENVASWYDSLLEERGAQFHQGVVLPGVLRLLELHRDEAVIDLACGQGIVSRALHEAGANVVGIDLSPKLIELARRRSPKEIRYLVGDARSVQAAPQASADAVVCVLAAMNIEPLDDLAAECGRLLKPSGRVVWVVMHPAFRIPRQSNWLWDESRKLLVRTVDRYLSPLKIPIDLRPFAGKGSPRQVTWTYHRPIGAYVNSLASAGLWTNALEEWPSIRASQPGPRAKAEDRARAEFPLFLALRAARQ